MSQLPVVIFIYTIRLKRNEEANVFQKLSVIYYNLNFQVPRCSISYRDN